MEKKPENKRQNILSNLKVQQNKLKEPNGAEAPQQYGTHWESGGGGLGSTREAYTYQIMGWW